MFNKKLKEKINNLNESNIKLLDSYSKLEFQLNNPPKYKIGQKIGKDCFVSDINIIKISKYGYFFPVFEYEYIIK